MMKQEEKQPYVFLHDRMERWNFRLELTGFLVVVGFALLSAIYSTHGFWSEFWDVIKPFL